MCITPAQNISFLSFIPTNMVNLEHRAYPDAQRDISRGREKISTPYSILWSGS